MSIQGEKFYLKVHEIKNQSQKLISEGWNRDCAEEIRLAEKRCQ